MLMRLFYITISTLFELNLAIRSLIQLQPDIITSRITQLAQIESMKRASMNLSLSSSAVNIQDFCSSIRTDGKFKSCRSRRIKCTWLRWKSYSLLLGRAWDMEIYRAQQGWDFYISVYAYVLHDSPVAKYTMDGNVEGLQILFSRGEASPFAVCLYIRPDGWFRTRTLLEVRIIYPYLYSNL
jgi:hypothetical protein